MRLFILSALTTFAACVPDSYISVQVSGPEGEPIAEVSVAAVCEVSVSAAGMTDEFGQAQINTFEDEFHDCVLYLAKEGHRTQEIALASREATVTLEVLP